MLNTIGGEKILHRSFGFSGALRRGHVSVRRSGARENYCKEYEILQTRKRTRAVSIGTRYCTLREDRKAVE